MNKNVKKIMKVMFKKMKQVENIPIHNQVENVILPNKSSSNFKLSEVVKNIDFKNFRCVFVRDTLPKLSTKKRMCNYKPILLEVPRTGLVGCNVKIINGILIASVYRNQLN